MGKEALVAHYENDNAFFYVKLVCGYYVCVFFYIIYIG